MLFTFSFSERIHLLSALPREENAIMLKMYREFREELSFSSDEITKHQLTEMASPDTGEVNYSWASEMPKEIAISDALKKSLLNLFEKLDRTHKLNDVLLDIWEKLTDAK